MWYMSKYHYSPEYYQTHDKAKYKEYRERNKEKIRARARERYITNRARAKAQCQAIRKRNKEYVLAFLSDKHCVDCWETDVEVLQFDHVRGKTPRGISGMISNSAKLAKLQSEIDKCEIRCANCHMRVTNKRRLQNLSPCGPWDGTECA